MFDAVPRMLAVLAGSATPPPPAAGVVNGGFENGMSPWTCSGQCGLDTTNLARTGTRNGWVRNTSGWNAIQQTISVEANRTYRVSGYIRTSANNTDGYFGLKTIGGTILGEKKYGTFANYTLVSVDVNTGSNTSLVLYGGLWANGDTWAQIDDVTTTPL